MAVFSKRFLALFCLLALALGVFCLSGAAEEAEPHYTLPIDFSPGKEPLKSGYVDDFTYEDPTISVKIKKKRTNDCDYWVATIKIADPSQLRTMPADSFDTDGKIDSTVLFERSKGVLAIGGDSYCYTGHGYILRQGKLYLDDLWNAKNIILRDVLLIDEDGNFHGVHRPSAGEVKKTINGKKVINAFYFGPLLVDNGQVQRSTIMDAAPAMAHDEPRQRMAICQVGPLEYKCICCGRPTPTNRGCTIAQFAQLVGTEHVQVAYNLDGGWATRMYFNGSVINDTDNYNYESQRELYDIIYFASAYEGEQ